MIKVDSLIQLHTIISLNNSPKHGYELIKELEEKLNKKISSSNVYPFLKELKKNDYVTYKKIKRGKVYTLTSKGKRFINETLSKFNNIIQESLRKKLTKCVHCGCEVYDNKYIEIINNKRLAFCCCHCAGSYKNGMKNECHK